MSKDFLIYIYIYILFTVLCSDRKDNKYSDRSRKKQLTVLYKYLLSRIFQKLLFFLSQDYHEWNNLEQEIVARH